MGREGVRDEEGRGRMRGGGMKVKVVHKRKTIYLHA
jgi:hypothetical protein